MFQIKVLDEIPKAYFRQYSRYRGRIYKVLSTYTLSTKRGWKTAFLIWDFGWNWIPAELCTLVEEVQTMEYRSNALVVEEAIFSPSPSIQEQKESLAGKGADFIEEVFSRFTQTTDECRLTLISIRGTRLHLVRQGKTILFHTEPQDD